MAVDGMPFEGKWEMESSKNFLCYLKTLGHNETMCKIGDEIKQIVLFHIAHDGQWTMTESSCFSSAITYFKLGEEFPQETLGGRHVHTKVVLEAPNKLVQKQKGDKETQITREVKDDKLICSFKCGEAEAERIYKKVK